MPNRNVIGNATYVPSTSVACMPLAIGLLKPENWIQLGLIIPIRRCDSYVIMFYVHVRSMHACMLVSMHSGGELLNGCRPRARPSTWRHAAATARSSVAVGERPSLPTAASRSQPPAMFRRAAGVSADTGLGDRVGLCYSGNNASLRRRCSSWSAAGTRTTMTVARWWNPSMSVACKCHVLLDLRIACCRCFLLQLVEDRLDFMSRQKR